MVERSACLACGAPILDTTHLCTQCITGTTVALREIATLADAFSPVIGSPGLGGRRSPGFGSRSPGRDEVISALDPRCDGIAGILSAWAHWAHGSRQSWQLRAACAYLAAQVRVIATRDVAGDFVHEIAACKRDALALAGMGKQRSVGPCLIDTCSGAVHSRPDTNGAECDTCGAYWSESALHELVKRVA